METDEPNSVTPNGEIVDVVGESSNSTNEGSGWTTTKAAAKVLGVSRRMVQEYVRRDDLEAFVEGNGVNKTYYVSIDSLNSLRERRRSEAKDAPNIRDVSSSIGSTANQGESSGESIGEVLFRTIERLEARAAEAADLRTRLELTTQAESTLREALEYERERANHAEKELQELRWRLDALSEQEALKTAAEDASSSGVVPPNAQEHQKHRSWLVRFFFGP